jgi:hypothetical protein
MLIVGAQTFKHLFAGIVDEVDGPLVYIYASDPEMPAKVEGKRRTRVDIRDDIPALMMASAKSGVRSSLGSSRVARIGGRKLT